MTAKQGPILLEESPSAASSMSLVRTHRPHRGALVPFHLSHLGFHVSRDPLRRRNDSSALYCGSPPLACRFDSTCRGLVKGLRRLGRKFAPASSSGFSSFLIGTARSLGGAKSAVWPGLSSQLPANHLGFPAHRCCRRPGRLNATLLAGILLGFGGVGLLMGRSALNSAPASLSVRLR